MNYRSMSKLVFVSVLTCSTSIFSVVDTFTYKKWENDCKKGDYDHVLVEYYELHNTEGGDRENMLEWRKKRIQDKLEMPLVWADMNYWMHHAKSETDSGADSRKRYFLRTCLATYGRLLLDSFATTGVEGAVECPIVELFKERIKKCFDGISISNEEFLNESGQAKIIITNKLNNDSNADTNASSQLPHPEIVVTARMRNASFWLKGTPSLECGSDEEREEARKYFSSKVKDLSDKRKVYLDQAWKEVKKLKDDLVAE